jgi:hypothetical protein
MLDCCPSHSTVQTTEKLTTAMPHFCVKCSLGKVLVFFFSWMYGTFILVHSSAAWFPFINGIYIINHKKRPKIFSSECLPKTGQHIRSVRFSAISMPPVKEWYNIDTQNQTDWKVRNDNVTQKQTDCKVRKNNVSMPFTVTAVVMLPLAPDTLRYFASPHLQHADHTRSNRPVYKAATQGPSQKRAFFSK